MKSRLLWAVFLLLSTSAVFAQHHPSQVAAGNGSASHFRISAGLAHTYLPEKTSAGTESLILPTIVLDLEYWFNHHWGIGLHNDLELFVFEVLDEDELFIEREYPILITLDALWKPVGGLVVFAGPGIEFEITENFFVFRAGCEYEVDISTHWDLAPLLFYDIRDGAYNTFTVGLGVGYRFGS